MSWRSTVLAFEVERLKPRHDHLMFSVMTKRALQNESGGFQHALRRNDKHRQVRIMAKEPVLRAKTPPVTVIPGGRSTRKSDDLPHLPFPHRKVANSQPQGHGHRPESHGDGRTGDPPRPRSTDMPGITSCWLRRREAITRWPDPHTNSQASLVRLREVVESVREVSPVPNPQSRPALPHPYMCGRRRVESPANRREARSDALPWTTPAGRENLDRSCAYARP